MLDNGQSAFKYGLTTGGAHRLRNAICIPHEGKSHRLSKKIILSFPEPYLPSTQFYENLKWCKIDFAPYPAEQNCRDV